jgi:hypothetical protein
MAFVMDLVAGDRLAILSTLADGDWAALEDPNRFGGHLSLGGSLDPTWLDLFSQAIRAVTGRGEPSDFLEARTEIDDHAVGGRTLERIDPGWITAIARVDDADIGPIAARWIDLVEEDLGDLPREEKPWIRSLAGDIVAFARRADRAQSVIVAWSLD